MTAGIVLPCPCGEVYELRPEYAGRLLQCATCGRTLRAGGLPGAARPAAPGADVAFERDVFLLRERALSIASKYEVRSEAGRPVLYIERPTYPIRTLGAYVLALFAAWTVTGWATELAAATGEHAFTIVVALGYSLAAATFLVVSMSARPLRHVTVYRDESRREILLRVVQDQRVALLVRTYTVVAPPSEPIARLRKPYPHNIVRKRWQVETPDGVPIVSAVEDSIVLSLLRRILGPLFGLLRTNFVLVGPEGAVIGEFNRKFTLLDRYVLDLTADPDRTLDRRIALALGVMLDTGERR